MENALHPTRYEQISVVDYIKEFGQKLDEYGDERTRPLARCPACGSEMYTKGEADPAVSGIFSHKPTSKFCPLKESAAKPYIILPPKDEDTMKTQKLRESFFKNWKLHWALMSKYISYISIFDFIKLIKYADKTKLWSYRNISEEQIPYIFMVLKEFPPVRNSKPPKQYLRKHWLRFWFDSRIRTIEDLWIQTNSDWSIIQATYANPKKSGVIPGVSQLKETKILSIDLKFLNVKEETPHKFIVEQMEKEFNKELKPNKNEETNTTKTV